MSFAVRLKQARENANLTQQELANALGVTKSAIGNYENGVSSPKCDVLLKIFDVLHVEPNFLYQDSFSATERDDLLSAFQALKERDQMRISEIAADFQKLNEDGKLKAVERVHELAEIPRYQNKYALAFDSYKENHFSSNQETSPTIAENEKD